MQRRITTLVAFLALGIALGAFFQPWLGQAQDGDARREALRAELEANREEFEGMSEGFRTVAELVSDSVVHVVVERSSPVRGASPLDDLFRRFGRGARPRPERRVTGQGSGVIIDPDGLIATNHHVVRGADRIRVVTSDRSEYEAEVVGADGETDVAVLRIDASDLPALEFGDSDALRVGDWVLAFGNPFGLEGTVSAGIISAVGRTGVGVAAYEDFLQTDAAINPGNSGGPLVNMAGEVVGITTAIASRTGGYQGIGFAIPSSMVEPIVDQLVEDGSVERGWLGVMIQDVTDGMARSLGLDEAHGVLVGQVLADSPAAEGGLRRGDVILRLDGEALADANGLRNAIAGIAPGTEVELVVLRDGEERSLTVTLGRRPRRGARGSGSPARPERPDAPDRPATVGFTASELTDRVRARYGIPGSVDGVVITEVARGSLADRAGLAPGMVIDGADREPVRSLDDLRAVLTPENLAGGVLLHVLADGRGRYVVLRRR